MLPIGIPSSFFMVLKTIFRKYIWQNKKSRVNNNLLTRKKKRGMALPDVSRYYKAITLARLVEWANLNTKKRWVKMEDTLYGTQLQKII